jgi:hypothetical protein
MASYWRSDQNVIATNRFLLHVSLSGLARVRTAYESESWSPCLRGPHWGQRSMVRGTVTQLWQRSGADPVMDDMSEWAAQPSPPLLLTATTLPSSIGGANRRSWQPGIWHINIAGCNCSFVNVTILNVCFLQLIYPMNVPLTNPKI